MCLQNGTYDMAATLTLISGPAALSYSRNAMTIQLETIATNSIVLLEIYDGSNVKLVTLQARPDNAFHVSFEISTILDTIVEFEKPTLTEQFLQATKPISLYHCIATELDSNLALLSTLNIGWDGTTASLRIIKGGLSAETQSKDILSYLKTNLKYLTWINEVNATKNQPLFLHYLSQVASETITVYLTIYFTDGTTVSTTLASLIVSQYDIWMINAGYSFNGFADYELGRTAYKYKIEILAGSVIRASIEIILSEEDYFKPVYILNANSLGGFDCHFFEGDGIVAQKADKSMAINNTDYNKKDVIFDATLEKSIELSTGFKSKKEMDSLAEMLLNKAVYEVVSNQLIPITFDKSMQVKYNYKSGLNGMKLKYSRANRNVNYTPDEFLD